MVNATATKLNNLYPHFSLHSISIKPLAMPIDPVPVVANLTIRGWTAGGEGTDEPLVFRVGWTSGYAEPLAIDFTSKDFSKFEWKGLGLLDFFAEFGPDQLDWEFCLDDLGVEFSKSHEEEGLNSKQDARGRSAKPTEWEEL
jgi:hypothetical protein